MKKRGLAVIYDPHNLYQFVWYYCNKGKEREWDALCLPNGYKGEYMHSYCEDAGIFQDIYRGEVDFSILPISQKLKMFAEMSIYFITGRRKKYCKKIINQYVDVEKYDEFVVIADVGIVSGACVALGKEKEVIILEDGINDYSSRSVLIPRKKVISLYAWQGFILSLMGYCSPGWFRLSTDKNCIKYCSCPEKMQYKNYKEIRQLYSDENTDTVLQDSILRKMYPKLSDYDFSKADAVLISRPLDDYVNAVDAYKRKLERFVADNYKSVIVKKHPREQEEYNFGTKVNVVEIDNSIPAEILLPFLAGRDILVTAASSILFYFKACGLTCKIILFDGMYEESLNSNTQGKAPTVEEIKNFADKFCENCYEIVQL